MVRKSKPNRKKTRNKNQPHFRVVIWPIAATWARQDLSLATKAVYQMLASKACKNKERLASPSKVYIAKHMGISQTSVSKACKALEGVGLIENMGLAHEGTTIIEYRVHGIDFRKPKSWRKAPKGKDRVRRSISKYLAYIDSDEWAELRDECLSEAGRTCVMCGAQAVTAHHHTYPPDWDYSKDKLSNLVALCWPCHRKEHPNHKDAPK